MSSSSGQNVQRPSHLSLYGDEQVYAILTSYLASRAEAIFEFDVLPRGFALAPGSCDPTLQDGNNIAILKHSLASVSVYAIQRFFSLIKEPSLDQHGSVSKPWIEAFEASGVILLFDPEHLTAANFRKRFILAIKQSAVLNSSDLSTLSLSQVIMNELAFLESLLTSPLHRHTKSPTLWSHRKWIKKQQPLLLALDSKKGKEPTGPDMLVEFSIVKKAGERHPKNYYAWTYARWLSKQVIKSDQPDSSNDGLEVTQELAIETSAWCSRNPTDTSGWSFLLFVLRGCSKDKNVRAMETILKYSTDFTWLNEAVWVFLRTVIASPEYLSVAMRVEFRKRINYFLDSTSKKTLIPQRESQVTPVKATLHLERAIAWIDRHGKLPRSE